MRLIGYLCAVLYKSTVLHVFNIKDKFKSSLITGCTAPWLPPTSTSVRINPCCSRGNHLGDSSGSKSVRTVRHSYQIIAMLSCSHLFQRLSRRVRRHYHRLDVRAHQLRVQRRQHRVLADHLLSDHQHRLSASVRPLLRHLRKTPVFLHLHHLLSDRLSGVRAREGCVLVECDEGSDGNWWRGIDDYGHHHQLRYHPLPTSRHVPSCAERAPRFWIHLWRLLRWSACRLGRLALVLSPASPNLRVRPGGWLLRHPAPRAC